MSNIFQELYTDLLDGVNRPAAESLTRVKREINNAIYDAQRRWKFQLTERLINFTYPANANMVSLTAACDGLPRDFITLQRADSTSGLPYGKPIDFKKYSEVTNDRRNWDRKQTGYAYPVSNIDEGSMDPTTHGSWVGEVHGNFAFLLNNKVGLYPRPTNDVPLLLNLHIWLPKLVNPEDTNFMLDYMYDYLYMVALRKLHLFFKVDSRYTPTAEEAALAWESVVAWDGSIANFQSGTNA